MRTSKSRGKRVAKISCNYDSRHSKKNIFICVTIPFTAISSVDARTTKNCLVSNCGLGKILFSAVNITGLRHFGYACNRPDKVCN